MDFVEKKRVVVAIPILLTGGTEIQTLNLIKVLSGADYSVIVLCYYEYEPDMVAGMEAAGAEVILLQLRRKDGLFSLTRHLYRQLKMLAPDIVHVQYVAPGLIPIIAARLAGIKNVIATVHQPGRTYGWKAKAMLRFGAGLCKIFLCVSKSAEESWFGDSALFDPQLYKEGRRHFTIYNAVDTEQIGREVNSREVAVLRDTLGLHDKKVIGYVGRLRWEKGVHILLDAFADVLREAPDVVLLIVGDGPDRGILEKQAVNLGINEQIIWLGQKRQEEVYRIYSLMNFMVIPSLFEGFGLTAAEAMAAGVPVIASNIDGLREVLDNGLYGTLVPVDDSSVLTKGIRKMLKEDRKRLDDLAVRGAGRIKNSFSTENYSDTVLKSYSLFDN